MAGRWSAVSWHGQAVTAHPDQPEPVAFNNRDAAAQADGRLTKGLRSRLSKVLLIVKFQVELRILLEFMTRHAAEDPGILGTSLPANQQGQLRRSCAASHMGGAGFQEGKKLRDPGSTDIASHGLGRIAQRGSWG